jgi:hypothetical protein
MKNTYKIKLVSLDVKWILRNEGVDGNGVLEYRI